MAETTPTDTYDESLNLIDVDSASIYEGVLTSLESGVGEPLYPGDERRIFAEAVVAVLVAYASRANDASRQTLLRYARGQVLDAMGERVGVERIDPTPATCTLRFTLSGPLDRATAIPSGTRATADGETYFATDVDAVIAPGDLTADVAASCTDPGEGGNGVPAGEVSSLVDLIPYVSSVANVDETHGGDDGEPYTADGDDRLRERIRLAPNAFSTAGPELAYRYWAMTADPGIADVGVVSEDYDDSVECAVYDGHALVGGDLLEPGELLTVNGSASGFTWTYEHSLLDVSLGPGLSSSGSVTVAVRRRMDGRVRVIPIMEGGEMPGEDVLEAVSAAVGSSSVRPMTDVVTVEAPTAVPYDIDVTYYCSPTDEAAVVAAVEGEGGAIDRYVAAQDSALGRDVNPDVLIAYVMEAGAIRCDVASPSHAAVRGDQVARHSGERAVAHVVESRAGWSD